MASVPRILVVGLGNAPAIFRRTRHSIGQRIVDGLGQRVGIAIRPDTVGEVLERRVNIGEVELSLALFKSAEAMNISGPSIAQALRRIDIKPASMIVISDSMSHHPDVLSARFGGSANGHNGLKSIIASVGGRPFHQFRIGIGRDGSDAADYVMGNMNNRELYYWQDGEGLDKIIKEIEQVAKKIRDE